MSEPTTPAAVPAAWYPDPAGGPRQRWWDGTQWTDHFSDPYSTQAVVLRAPEGTKAYNVWIWLVVFVPYLSLPFLFVFDFGTLFRDIDFTDASSSTAVQLQFFTSLGYLGLLFASYLLAALVVLFSYLDWRSLRAAGVPKPFHWAWAFFSVLGYPVYAIGRAVVTKRRTGHGSGVLWTAIGMIVVGAVVGIGLGISIFVTVMQVVSTSIY